MEKNAYLIGLIALTSCMRRARVHYEKSLFNFCQPIIDSRLDLVPETWVFGYESAVKKWVF